MEENTDDLKDWLEISKQFDDEIKKELPKEDGVVIDESRGKTNRLLFQEAYELCISLLRKYLDLKEEYYNIIALWILGTYFHSNFITYPYLFLNAMKGSGKTRLLKLAMALSDEGEVQGSMTEAVLFRSNEPIGIDEFEGVGRKGIENFRELMNSAYKRGTYVYRMKEVKTPEGKDHIKQRFDVFRPIMMANIWGMEDVLGDRCISLILEKSNREDITDLIEIFETEFAYKKMKKIMAFLKNEGVWCSLCSVVSLYEVYMEWNSNRNRTDTTPIYTTSLDTYNYTKLHLFKKIKEKHITGRPLELSLPLFFIAMEMPDNNILEKTLDFAKNYTEDKKEDELAENKFILIYEFIAGYISGEYHSIKKLTQDFQNATDIHDEWCNERWMGRSLKTLNLITKKKRYSSGVHVMLDTEKAQEKLKLFKPDETKQTIRQTE